MKRRDFLKTTGIAAAGAGLLGGLNIANAAQVSGDDCIKVALVGCGGRGRGAVQDRMAVGDNIKIVAVADAFERQAKGAANAFKGMEDERIDIGDNVFWGFDAFQKAIDCCDQVLIATSPGFRPIHYKYAIEQGKHVFMEKPCCVDAPGYRSLMETNKLADEKKLTVVVGLQRRYEPQYQEFMQQIADGTMGDVMYSRVYWNGGGIWERGRNEGQTEMDYQMNNWYHFVWLSGDNICEQHVHNIDIGCWAHCAGKDPKDAHPVSVNAQGGRQVRKYPKFQNSGHRYDHFFCEFTFADGSQMFSQCRHIDNTWNNVSETIYGTKGMGGPGWIKDRDGNDLWRCKTKGVQPYQEEHKKQAEFIRNGVAHNDGYYAANSSFTAVFGRMAAMSGKELTWDEAVAKGKEEMPVNGVWDWNANPPVMPDANGLSYEDAVPQPGTWDWQQK